MRTLAPFALAVLVAACGDDATAPDGLSPEQAVQVAMFEALFELEGWQSSAAYCVSHGEWAARADPDADVLARLQREGRPEVLGNSHCIVNLQGTFRVDNNEQGQSFHIDAVALEGDQAMVTGLYRNHPLGAGGYECRIVREDEEWVAESCTPTWIA